MGVPVANLYFVGTPIQHSGHPQTHRTLLCIQHWPHCCCYPATGVLYKTCLVAVSYRVGPWGTLQKDALLRWSSCISLAVLLAICQRWTANRASLFHQSPTKPTIWWFNRIMLYMCTIINHRNTRPCNIYQRPALSGTQNLIQAFPSLEGKVFGEKLRCYANPEEAIRDEALLIHFMKINIKTERNVWKNA